MHKHCVFHMESDEKLSYQDISHILVSLSLIYAWMQISDGLMVRNERLRGRYGSFPEMVEFGMHSPIVWVKSETKHANQNQKYHDLDILDMS